MTIWMTHHDKKGGLQVSVVVSRASTSLGDALRAIDSKGCIGSDFVLISGNTVTNMDLRVPLAEHKARREKDRNAIMTLVGFPSDEPDLPLCCSTAGVEWRQLWAKTERVVMLHW